MGDVRKKYYDPRCEFLCEHDTFLHPISGGGCPPPVSPPVSPPPPPPAQPHTVATPPGALTGSMWVEGAELHYIDSGGTEYAETGTSVGTPPSAVVGSLWMESSDIHYIDASGVERVVSKTDMGAKPAPSIEGSIWHDPAPPAGRRVLWIGNANKYQWWNGF